MPEMLTADEKFPTSFNDFFHRFYFQGNHFDQNALLLVLSNNMVTAGLGILESSLVTSL